MAKIGEGDARWIVSEREDGANVSPVVTVSVGASSLSLLHLGREAPSWLTLQDPFPILH